MLIFWAKCVFSSIVLLIGGGVLEDYSHGSGEWLMGLAYFGLLLSIIGLIFSAPWHM